MSSIYLKKRTELDYKTSILNPQFKEFKCRGSCFFQPIYHEETANFNKSQHFTKKDPKKEYFITL